MEKTTPTRIFITGITGFVGSHLVEGCRRHYPQAKVFGLYNHNVPLPNAPAMEHVTLLKADVTQAEEVRSALAQAQPDVIFHLAAQSSVALSWSDPVRTLQVNTFGALHLLEAIRLKHPTTRVLLVGSGEQYGVVQPQDNPIGEDHALRPGNPYAVSKAAQDLYGYQYYAAHGLPIIRVRSFNHFGPRQADTFVIPSFARQIALIEAGKAEPVIRVGNLQAKRDFLPIEDVINAYVAVAVCGRPGEVYNVGSGKAHSIGEVLASLLSYAKKPIRVCEDAARMRPLDIPILEADISHIQKHTGWKCSVSFESALKETLDYWRTVVAADLLRNR